MKSKKKTRPSGQGAAAHVAAPAELPAAAVDVDLARERLQRLERLDGYRSRLAGVDVSFWPIHERVLRSQVHIRRIGERLGQGEPPTEADFTGIELINALWWEIRALEYLRKWPKGKGPGAVRKALEALLDENPDATSHDARRRLNQEIPEHGLKATSVTVALSKAKARRKKP